MKKIVVLLVIATLIGCFFIFDVQQYLDFAYVKSKQQVITDYFHAYPLKTILIFFFVYVVVAALSLPAVGVLSILSGAIFGLLPGTGIVLLAATLGATIAFWFSRYVFRDFVQNCFGDKLQVINRGIEKDGAFYLFTLRLIPIFPFFIINLAMGLTPMRTIVFFVTSLAGMIAGSFVFVNIGTRLANVDSLDGIFTPAIIFAFLLLAIFPWLARKIVTILKARRVYKGFTKPKKFDYNLIVIGAGSAGLVTAYIAATVKAKVALIEKNRMGGDCLNTGCVPSKALIRSAKFISQVRRAEQYGCKHAEVEFEFKDVMARVRRVIKKVEPHDSPERYTMLGVTCIRGNATLHDPWTVSVDGETLTGNAIVLATGAAPFIPNLPGLDKDYYTSDTIWDLTELPRRMTVLGGGPIGCELAQCFARFGTHVTLIQKGPRILPREDPEISDMVATSLAQDGIQIMTQHVAVEVMRHDDAKALVCNHKGKDVKIPFDTLLIAVGRSACTQNVWDKSLKIGISQNGRLEVNEYLQTNYPNVYACGDVTGAYEFTHVAAHQAWYVGVNALFGKFKKFRVDYSIIPWCTFTEPEVARVGLNEEQARKRNIDYEVTRYDISDLDRAIADEEARGIVKVITPKGKDKILGATIVAAHAGELITEYISAMKHKLGLNKILGTIHVYPTLSEANKYAAGEWKKAHAPEKVLHWLKKYHTFQRS